MDRFGAPLRRLRRWPAAVAGALALLGAGLLAAPAPAAPACSGGLRKPVVLVQTGDVLEYGLFDSRGRFFYSDQTSGELVRIDVLGARGASGAPHAVAAISSPGAIVGLPSGRLLIGVGDGLQFGAMGDFSPRAQLWNVDPRTGRHTVVATGLGMANGIARARNGAVYATNDLGFDVDRVVGGRVTHPWARVYSTNGVVISPDGRYLYVSQTFTPAAVSRITIARPSQVTTLTTASPADSSAGLDDMATDRAGNLYVAANGGGQIWRIDRRGAICELAGGLELPSAVNFGRGRHSRDLYFVTFGGQIGYVPGVLGRRAR